MNTHIRSSIYLLLQGPHEVGNMILGFEGVTQIMIGLATSIIHEHSYKILYIFAVTGSP